MDYEDERLEVGDDCEGAELTSNPPTPSSSRPPSPDPLEVEPVRPTSPSPSECSSELSSVPPSPGPSQVALPIQHTSPPCPAPPGSVEKRRKKDSAKVRKKKKRAAKAAAADPLEAYRPRAPTLKKLEKSASVSVKFNAKSLEGSGASYVGRRQKTSPRGLSSAQQLRRAGIKVNKWNGM